VSGGRLSACKYGVLSDELICQEFEARPINERNICDETSSCIIGTILLVFQYTRVVCKVRGLAAVRRCYAEAGGDCYAKL
jgi:hypothetical protein